MALLKMARTDRTLERWRFACRACVWAGLIALTSIVARGAGELPAPEYQVKAAFLFNFAQFVQWPARAFPDGRSPFVVGILGDDPFGDYLDHLTAGEKIGDHPIEVRRYRRVDDVRDCHILFVSRSEDGRLEKVLNQFKGRSVLTVGDADDFSRRGGIIRFVTESGKIRLRVDVAAAKEADLSISSKLLRPAVIVTKEHD